MLQGRQSHLFINEILEEDSRNPWMAVEYKGMTIHYKAIMASWGQRPPSASV